MNFQKEKLENLRHFCLDELRFYSNCTYNSIDMVVIRESEKLPKLEKQQYLPHFDQVKDYKVPHQALHITKDFVAYD